MLKNISYKLLKKSEKYTRTDMVYLAKGGFWLTLSQIIAMLSGLLLTIIFANLVPKETYGTYKYILSVIAILIIPSLTGMGTSVTQATARGYDGSFWSSIKIKMRWGILSSLASLILAIYYFINSNYTLAVSFSIITIFISFIDSLEIYQSFLQGKKLFDISAKFSILTQILSTLVIIITIVITSNIIYILLSYLLSYTIFRLIFSLKTKKYINNKKEDPDMVNYGKHLSLMSVISLIAMQLDKVLIFHYLGAIEMAVYSIAIAPPEYLKGIFKNISNLALPKFAQNNDSTNIDKKNLLTKILKFSLIIFVSSIIYIVAAPIIFKIFLPKYQDSIIYSQVFAISTFTLINIIPVTLMRARKMTKELYQYNFYSFGVQIILLLIFVQPFGLMGVIIARIIARIFGVLLSFLYMNNIK